MKAAYFAYTFVFLGLGLLYPTNILIGFPESKFIKYAIFYFLTSAVVFLLLVSGKLRRSHLENGARFVALFGFCLLIDIYLYRSYVDPFDAIRGGAILLSWWLIYVGISSIVDSKYTAADSGLTFLLAPYFLICVTMLVGVLAGTLIILVTGVDLVSFGISERFGFEFYGRMDRNIENRFKGIDEFISPYGVTLFAISPRTLTISGFPVVLNGWAYEPHLFAFFLGPSIFVARHFIRSNILYYSYVSLFFFAMIGASSATFWIAFSISAVVVLMVKKDKARFEFGRFCALVFYCIAILAVCIIVFPDAVLGALLSLWEVIDNKLINPTGISKETTVGYWAGLLAPESIFGKGPWFVPDVGRIKGVDFGFLGLFSILGIFCGMAVVVVSLLITNSSLARSYGVGLLYVMIHALKFPLMFFTYPIWAFWFGAGYWYLRKRKRHQYA